MRQQVQAPPAIGRVIQVLLRLAAERPARRWLSWPTACLLSGAGLCGQTLVDSGQLLGADQTEDVALGDLDGDDDLDLVYVNSGEGQPNQVWINNGLGVFQDSGQLLAANTTTCVVLGDIDQDADLDFVAANYEANRVWVNDGSGSFTDSGQALGSGLTLEVALADVTGDGDLDLITGENGGTEVLLNDGGGLFTLAWQTPPPSSGATHDVDVADLDGDGDVDFVAGRAGIPADPGNKVWRNNGSGGFVLGTVFGNGKTRSAVLGDLNADGSLDYVAGDLNANRIWIGDGTGGFTDSGQGLGSEQTHGVVLVDVELNGTLDLIASNFTDDNVVWLNDGAAQFAVGQLFGDTSNGYTDIAAGDLDQDGDVDFVSAKLNDKAGRVWINDLLCPSIATPSIALGGAPACAGVTGLTLSAPDGYLAYEWHKDGAPVSGPPFSGEAAQHLVVDTDDPAAVQGDYSVWVGYSGTACSVESFALTVTAGDVLTAPMVELLGSPACPGTTDLTLSVVGSFDSYAWFDEAGLSVGSGPQLTLPGSNPAALVGKSYTVEVSATGATCVVESDPIAIVQEDFLAVPSVSLAGSPACEGGADLVLSAGGGYDSYVWLDEGGVQVGSGPELMLPSSDPSAVIGKSYTVEVSLAGATCAVESAAILIDAGDFVEVPAVVLTNSPTCEDGGDLLLSAAGGYDSYVWLDEGGVQVGTGPQLALPSSNPGALVGKSYTVEVSKTGATCVVDSDPVSIGTEQFVFKPSITLGGSPACPGLTELVLWVPDDYVSYLWYQGTERISAASTHELRLTTSSPNDLYGDYSVVVVDALSGCSLMTDPVTISPADFLEEPCEVVISNGTIDLSVSPNPDFGLVTEHLVNLSVSGPAGPGEGVFFAPTDLWKVTFRNKDLAGYVAPLTDPCDSLVGTDPCDPPADGLIHVRASDVTAMPTLSVGPDPLAPTELRARWQIHAGAIEAIDDADAGTFDMEPFEVEVIYETKGDDDFVTIRMNARLTSSDPRLSIYRLELRTAAQLEGTPQNQVLSMPWYFGVLVPDPLNAPELDLANCYADVRLSDPEHGKSVPTHPGVYSMQWMSYYQTEDAEKDLLYWGTRDTGNHIKPYALYRETEAIGFGVQYQPVDNLSVTGQEDLDGDGESDGVGMPFEVVMTALKGDWYDAAQYYREWAIDPSWTWIPDHAPGDPSSSYSEAMFRAQTLGTISLASCVGGTTKNYSYFEHWSDEWAGYQSFFGLDPVDGMIGRPWFWDYNSFDASFGDWFPTRTEFLDEVSEVGYPWAPYFHPLVLHPDSSGLDSASIPGEIADYVVRDEYELAHEACIKAVPKTVGCSSEQDDFLQQILCSAAVPDGFSPQDTVALLYSKHVLGGLDADVKAWLGAISGAYLDEYHHIERVCYADHGHPIGGDGSYFIDGKQALAVFLKQWMTSELGIAEPFLWTESASEPYVGVVEACNLSYGGIFGVALEAGSVRRAPMFQTVYNEYQRFASVLPVNLPLVFQLPGYAKDMAISRHHLARFSYESGEFALGTVLSPSLLADKLADEPYSMAVGMVREIAEVLKTDEARDLMRFGQRFRDPGVASVFVPSKSSGSLNVALQEEDEDLTFPPVYASACGQSGERVGVLLVNWTAVSDLLVAPGLVKATLPGDQLVTLTLDPESYGFAPAATLTLRDVETGVATTVPWGGGDLLLTRDVPQLSAELLVLEP
ncbi:MAG: FG-GAP-like repeat-containing protein [Planctomycetota bacterium]